MLIKKVSTSHELSECLAIRNEVFVKGQNIPEPIEVDGLDNISDHYLLLLNNKPVGTARVRLSQSTAKIERVAILNNFQKKGLGQKLMNFIIQDLRKNPSVKKAILGAQMYVVDFYQRLGFKVCGKEYFEAGILHKDMELSLIQTPECKK